MDLFPQVFNFSSRERHSMPYLPTPIERGVPLADLVNLFEELDKGFQCSLKTSFVAAPVSWQRFFQ